jgi:exosortase
LALIAVAAVMRFASAYYHFALLDPMSLVPVLAGIALFAGGWRVLRWAGPSIVFVGLMVPLPGAIGGLLSHPLQRAGTMSATYALQTLGFPAVAQGNVIVLSDTQLGVVEACSGLRMMMLFFAVSFAIAFLVKRPLLDRVIILASAAPVALVANIARIVTTGMLHDLASHKAADALFHDLAGWFMMPLAVLLLWLELGLLARLLTPPRSLAPVPWSAATMSNLGKTAKQNQESLRGR